MIKRYWKKGKKQRRIIILLSILLLILLFVMRDDYQPALLFLRKYIFLIQQIPNGSKSTFTVYVGDKNVWTKTINDPPVLSNLRVYESNPALTAASVQTKDYKWISGIYAVFFQFFLVSLNPRL